MREEQAKHRKTVRDVTTESLWLAARTVLVGAHDGLCLLEVRLAGQVRLVAWHGAGQRQAEGAVDGRVIGCRVLTHRLRGVRHLVLQGRVLHSVKVPGVRGQMEHEALVAVALGCCRVHLLGVEANWGRALRHGRRH